MNAEREIMNNAPQVARTAGINSTQPTSSDGFDAIKMLWRWKGLIALGLLIGLAVGYLVMIQMPPQYTSTSLVQILSPSQQNLKTGKLDLGESILETKQDEIRIMRGGRVIENAIRAGKLDQHRMFTGMSQEEIFRWIVDEDKLFVAPGTREARTDLIDIRFTCEDKELATEVVQAILNGYQQYLNDAYSDRGSEVFDRLAEYKDEFSERYKKLSEQYVQARKQMPVLVVGEVIKDPFAESAENFSRRVTEIKIELERIDSMMQQIANAGKAGRPPEAMLDLLERERLGQFDRERVETSLEIIQRMNSINGESSEAGRMQERLTMALLERDRLTKQLGQKNPQVVNLDSQISTLERGLEEQRTADRQRIESILEELDRRSVTSATPEERLSRAVASIQEQRQALISEKTSLEKMVSEEQQKSRELSGGLAMIEMLKGEKDLMEETSTDLKQALQSLQIGADYNRKKMIVQNFPKIGVQTGPSLFKYLGIGGIFGLALFSGLAYLLEMADRSYRSPEEILRSLSMPVLGHIPIFEVDRRDQRDELIDASVVTLHKPQSNTSECYRGIRTALFFSKMNDMGRSMKVIQVTSPLPGDGKSTLAANVAVSLAQSGRQVLFVDCDLRRPRGAKVFGVKDEAGLCSCLTSDVAADDVIQASSVENLSIMTSGPRVANPSELLVLPEFQALIGELRNKFDFVVIDTPPMLSVSDPANVAPFVDAVILTMRLRRNSRPIAEQAKNILDSVNANIVGVVINGVGAKNNYGYGGYRYETSGVAGYSYGNRSYGYGGSEKVYGDEQMQTIAKNRATRTGRRNAPTS